MPTRIIRDGILTSERVDLLSVEAEVFYRRLMSVVDDYGRYSAKPSILRSYCYPLRTDSLTEKMITGYLQECIDAGLIIVYTANQKDFLEIQDFGQRQQSKSKYPEPPQNTEFDGYIEHLTEIHGESRLKTALVEDVVGVVDVCEDVAEETLSPSGDVDLIFKYWQESMNHPLSKLDQKRRKRITDALKKYPPAFLKKAIDGCKLSPHHMGKNESGTVYDDIELILRDTPHIEKFAGFVDRPPAPKFSKAESRANTIQALTGQSPQGGDNGRVIDITPAAAVKR